MAKRITKEEREARIKALVAAMLAEEEAEGLDVEHETIDDIEDAMIRIGDSVAREVGVQKLARHTGEASGSCPCPHCGQAGVYVKRRARELISSRGNVPLSEAKYYCPKCRRNFFPSDGSIGD
jgi:Zn finger protein HypA/HybF involved in hydrogenase expression